MVYFKHSYFGTSSGRIRLWMIFLLADKAGPLTQIVADLRQFTRSLVQFSSTSLATCLSFEEKLKGNTLRNLERSPEIIFENINENCKAKVHTIKPTIRIGCLSGDAAASGRFQYTFVSGKHYIVGPLSTGGRLIQQPCPGALFYRFGARVSVR